MVETNSFEGTLGPVRLTLKESSRVAVHDSEGMLVIELPVQTDHLKCVLGGLTLQFNNEAGSLTFLPESDDQILVSVVANGSKRLSTRMTKDQLASFFAAPLPLADVAGFYTSL